VRQHASERARRFRTVVPRLSRFVAEHLLLLPLGAIVAMTWVNLDPESYYPFTYAIAFAGFWPYVIAGGGLSWAALYLGGFHPAFALLPILPFLPHAPRDPGFFVDAPPEARDALNTFERWVRYPAQVALFFFALVNAGIPFRGLEWGTLAVPVAVLAGKPIGLLAAAALAALAGFHLPERVTWRELIVMGFITAAGFTVALFFATATMAPGQMLRETSMGVLIGLSAIGAAFAAARLLRTGRFAR
jgi:Na+:H+ antiporter, NhaA family